MSNLMTVGLILIALGILCVLVIGIRVTAEFLEEGDLIGIALLWSVPLIGIGFILVLLSGIL